MPLACFVVPKRVVGRSAAENPGNSGLSGTFGGLSPTGSSAQPESSALPDQGGLAIVQGEVIEASEVSGRTYEPLEAANGPLEAATPAGQLASAGVLQAGPRLAGQCLTGRLDR